MDVCNTVTEKNENRDKSTRIYRDLYVADGVFWSLSAWPEYDATGTAHLPSINSVNK